MKTLDELLDLAAVRPPVQATVPPFGVIYYRHPTMEEWHSITTAHRDSTNGVASVSLIAKTVATVLADETGKRIMSPADAGRLLDKDYAAVMALYRNALDTVFALSDEKVEESEKN